MGWFGPCFGLFLEGFAVFQVVLCGFLCLCCVVGMFSRVLVAGSLGEESRIGVTTNPLKVNLGFTFELLSRLPGEL